MVAAEERKMEERKRNAKKTSQSENKPVKQADHKDSKKPEKKEA
jgi:hypothetical protein